MQGSLERLRQRREELGDEGGFTLIELLIVIVILAILAAIVVFAVQNLTSSSAKSACESDVQTTDHAVQTYFAQVGAWPNGTAELEQASGQVTLSDGTKNSGPWLHNTPTNGTNYAIDVSPSIVGGAAGPWTDTSLTGNTKTAVTVVVLGKWDSKNTNWTTEEIYNPPSGGAGQVTTPGAACANL